MRSVCVPKLITEGIKLWNDISFFTKSVAYAIMVTLEITEIDNSDDTFNVANMNSGVWLFFGELNKDPGGERFQQLS